ncbi:hypothetical protein FJT64_004771 [Amphibalanus amphitrite]|uniref:Ig-like domain-containing protein n=1 Tax=Amphibalanus amphitrite TaxID=1232801 RepID=A0A6A4W6Y2_AMPAM|nr:hypothetical protein FJT64_004771 [Amphibalanus amphitrite]
MHQRNIMIKCGLIVLVLADGRRVAGNSPYQPRHVAEGPPFVDSHPPRPEFDPSMASHVTSLHGRDARLNCIVRTLENNTVRRSEGSPQLTCASRIGQVSWIRQADLHILTIGRYTYTTDLRFGAEHEPGSAIWTLAIRGARHNDSGLYDCQISTKPLLTTTVNFTVIGEWSLCSVRAAPCENDPTQPCNKCPAKKNGPRIPNFNYPLALVHHNAQDVTKLGVLLHVC